MCICVFNSTIHDVQSLFITTNSQLSFFEMKKVYHKNKKNNKNENKKRQGRYKSRKSSCEHTQQLPES